jgi:hydrogenase nickel incorporation protein HypA/HybF
VHEFGYAEGVLAAVRQRADGRRVRRVRLRAGVRHGLDQPTMAQAFRLVAEGTEAQDAELDLVPVPARLDCRECRGTAQVYDTLACCPYCAGEAVDVAGGDELVLESLTYLLDRD